MVKHPWSFTSLCVPRLQPQSLFFFTILYVTVLIWSKLGGSSRQETLTGTFICWIYFWNVGFSLFCPDLVTSVIVNRLTLQRNSFSLPRWGSWRTVGTGSLLAVLMGTHTAHGAGFLPGMAQRQCHSSHQAFLRAGRATSFKERIPPAAPTTCNSCEYSALWRTSSNIKKRISLHEITPGHGTPQPGGLATERLKSAQVWN